MTYPQRPMRMGVSLLAALMLAVLVLSVPAHATGAKGAWPQDASDLKADPSARFGVLANGMRYVVKRTANPQGTLSMRMRIEAGSLHENENERGVAHFLEHMAFNGSQNYPEGEMFKALQRMGMQIGSAANASTGYDSTVFSMSLPSVRAEVLNTGFSIMREIVGRLTISQEAVDRERGVILSEERARDTPGSRSMQAEVGLWFAGQRYPNRAPIGDMAFVRSATAEDLRSFYLRNYRPERALLVVAGDAPLDALEARVRSTFADWQPPGPARPPVGFDKPAARGLTAASQSGSATDDMLSISWVQPADSKPETAARRLETHRRIVAFTVLNRRLSKLARLPDAPFIAAQVSRDLVRGGGIVSTLTIRPRNGDWQRGLAAAEQELRRALVHGLQQSEVEREALEQRSPYLLAAANANTRPNMDVAEILLDSIVEGRVPTDPQTDLELYTKNIAGIRAQDVTRVLKSTFKGAGPLIYLSSSRPVEGGEAAIRRAYQASVNVAVAPPPKDAIKQFTYRDFGKPGQVVSTVAQHDLGVTQVRFANGVMLNVKPTDFEKDRVSVVARMAGGNMALPMGKRGLSGVLPFAFVEGGLGQLEMGELEQTEPGHFAGINLDVDDDTFQLFGDTVERDVLLQLQVLAAFTTDPAYRPDGLRRLQSTVDGQFKQQNSKPVGVLNRELSGIVRGGDDRWVAPTPDDLRALTMDDVRAALAPSLARAPIEVTIVGHVKLAAAIDATARTFGALPPRDPAFKPGSAGAAGFPARGQSLTFTHEGRADQAAVVSIWPGPSRFPDTRQEKAVAVLSEIIQLRLIDEVREAQGGTYTPFGSAYASQMDGYGYIFAGVEPSPDAADRFFETLAAITRELREGEVPKDLLDRARRPLLYQLYAAQTSNEYWIRGLLDVQRDPRTLASLRNDVDEIADVTAADVRAAAQRFLDDRRRIDVKVLPKR